MRFVSFAVLATLALFGSASAMPTIAHLQNISVGGSEVLPSGIATNGLDLYVAGFAQRRVVKVTGAQTSTPLSSILFRTSNADAPAGPTPWVANTGLVSADFQAPNRLLVAGDTFTDGAMTIINTDTGVLINQQGANLDGGSPIRVASAVFYGPSNIVGAFQAGSNYFQYNSTISGLTGAGFYAGPGPAASRDIVVGNNNTIYIAYNTGAGVIGVHRWADDVTSPLSLSGNTTTPAWYTTTTTGAGNTINGIGRLLYGATEYIVVTNPALGRLELVDSSNPATTVTLTNASLTAPRDVVSFTVNGSQYLAVTQYDAPDGGRVSIFGIDGATLNPTALGASTWMQYN